MSQPHKDDTASKSSLPIQSGDPSQHEVYASPLKIGPREYKESAPNDKMCMGLDNESILHLYEVLNIEGHLWT
jgi:hypothetical protein